MKLLARPPFRYALVGGIASLTEMMLLRGLEWACVAYGWWGLRRLLWSPWVVGPSVALMPSLLIDGKPRPDESLLGLIETAAWVAVLGGLVWGLVGYLIYAKGPIGRALKVIGVVLVLFYWYTIFLSRYRLV